MVQSKWMPAVVLFCCSGALSAANASEGAAVNAQQLLTENCTRCHGSEVYTRDDRRVTSWEGLQKQVRNCELMLDLTWFDDQRAAVANHLNAQYYHFDKPQGDQAAQ